MSIALTVPPSGRRTAPRVRRSQEERSASTRAKLLDAAIQCLIERGYARTTTTEIAVRAGVSRGAQLHHYPSKIALVTSAVQHLAERRIEALRREASSLPAGGERISQVTELLWSSFSGPLFVAAVELWVAARTDPKLHAALKPLEVRLGHIIQDLCRELYGDTAQDPNFRILIRATVYLMRGMALERILTADERKRREVLRFWEIMMATVLGGR